MRTKTILNFLLISSLAGQMTFAKSLEKDYEKETSYCAAIRGNGELMPAHWGSFAKLTERYGLPSAMAGGSSASITMFILESISLNQLAKTHLEKALLVKSIEGYAQALAKTKEGKAMARLLRNRKKIEGMITKMLKKQEKEVSKHQGLSSEILLKHLEDAEKILNSDDLRSLANPELLGYMLETRNLAEEFQKSGDLTTWGQAQYRYTQIRDAFKNFGSFNVRTDKTLFFRPGIISFDAVASKLGRLGNFYAGYGLGEGNKKKAKSDFYMQTFIKKCSVGSKGKSWKQISKKIVKVKSKNASCKKVLSDAVLTYRKEMQKLESAGASFPKRIEDKVGSHLATFPTTSLLIKGGVSRYREAHAEYKQNTDPEFGEDFRIHPAQLRFGYWGAETELKKISQNLKSKSGFTAGNGEHLNYGQDKKSQKFKSLGNASWHTALSISPAEPGLARILPIPGQKDILSAGGWSDLHPTLVLRALGCQNVMYVTRRGGESNFAQGTIKKLTGISGYEWADWDGLSAEEKRLKNAKGDETDRGVKASAWSKMYNLANPESSYAKSLAAADAIWCTNWDMGDIKDGAAKLVAEGYRAPLYHKTGDFFREGISEGEYASQLLTEEEAAKNPYQYSGCVENQ